MRFEGLAGRLSGGRPHSATIILPQALIQGDEGHDYAFAAIEFYATWGVRLATGKEHV
jgi:hypothetical protein